MGILGEMAKGLFGKASGGSSSQNPLMDIVMGLITNPQKRVVWYLGKVIIELCGASRASETLSV